MNDQFNTTGNQLASEYSMNINTDISTQEEDFGNDILVGSKGSNNIPENQENECEPILNSSTVNNIILGSFGDDFLSGGENDVLYGNVDDVSGVNKNKITSMVVDK